VYRRLLKYLRPHSGRMAGTIAANLVAALFDVFSLSLLTALLGALFPAVSAPGLPRGGGAKSPIEQRLDQLIGAFAEGNDPFDTLKVVLAFVIASVALKNLFVWVSSQWSAQLQEYVTRDLRNDVYGHLSRLPLPWFTRTKTGQIITRVITDTAQTKQLITALVTVSLQNAALVVTYVTYLMLYSVKLTLLALVVAPLLIAGLQPLLKRLRKRHRRLANEWGELTSRVQETMSGIRLVKSYGAEPHERTRFFEASDRYAQAQVKVVRASALAQPITETAGTLIAAMVLWVGARQVLVEGTLTGEALIAFLVIVMRMLQPLKQLSQIPTVAQGSMAAAERLFEVLDTIDEQQSDRGTREVRSLEREVRFEGVGFTYGDEPVLRDVGFVAPRGTVTALVGPSGAGKSTLVDLIPRFIEPTEGRILLDGVDTRELRLPALRALTGIVSQDTVLFNDTVRNNIAYGRAEAYTDAEIEAAARAANAHAFITELPEGYATVLGERGTRLSGGQRQRIAIARALLLNPPILILDEATSALDTESERLVQEAIDRLLAGRTVFVIAHRLSTVEHADQILVLERGRIVERGTHVDLLALRGAYHRLHALQFREPRPEPRDQQRDDERDDGAFDDDVGAAATAADDAA
jgi:subfamily B ATP-binding cassette protein MsbA